MKTACGESKLHGISAQVCCGSFAAMILGTTTSMAAVAYPEDTMVYGNIDETADNGSFKFDLNRDGKKDFRIEAYPPPGEKANIYGLKQINFSSKIANQLFSTGNSIDASASFFGAMEIYPLGLEVGQTAYLGLRLEGHSGDFNYGWVEITRGSVTLGESGYQSEINVEAPIPPVPLPASLPLLALGVGGLAALRRKRKAAAA